MSNSIMSPATLQGRWLAPVTSRKFSEPEDASELLNFDASDQGNAEAVVSLFGEKIRHTTEVGWLVWNGTHYEASEERAWSMVEETLQKRREAAVKAERSEKNERLIKLCVGDAYRVEQVMKSLSMKVRARIADFDTHPDLLNVKNGVLDLKTGKLSPHSPGQLFTYCLETRWNPDADTSQWEQFIRAAVKGGDEMIDFLRQAVGYSLTGHTREEAMFYIYGPSRAGKGVFVETLRALLGNALSAGVPFTTFTQKRDGQNFDLARLKSSRLVVASESERWQRLNAAMVKDITGGGVVSCSFKHRDTFEYKPVHKIWLTSNFPINGDPDDDALWTRLRVIEFPNSHAGYEDTTLKSRLQSPEVLEGLLKWAVTGAQEWYAAGRLATPEVSKQAKDEHREQADSVGLWLAECCKIREGEFTATHRVRGSYEKWCEDNGFEPKKARTFNESLTRRGLLPNQNGRDLSGSTCKGVKSLVIPLD